MFRKIRPDSVCIVPEAKHEVTTQGGLKLTGKTAHIEKCVAKLAKTGISVSLFVDPNAAEIRIAHKIGASTVELCTSRYAATHGQSRQVEELEKLQLAGFLAKELKLHLHAGHGLDYHNAAPVARIDSMECLNIGYSIVSRALFAGLKSAVSEMKRLIQ